MKKIFALLILAVIITAAVFMVERQFEEQTAFTADNLIRIHVIANSDSPGDQALKLKVKDRLVKWLSPQLADSGSAVQSRAILAGNLDLIKKVADQEVTAQGEAYSTRVMLGEYDFPTRTYGDVTLPQGKYQALRVVLGEGEGANWWCVLYPPLCIEPNSSPYSSSWLLDKIAAVKKKQAVRVNAKPVRVTPEKGS